MSKKLYKATQEIERKDEALRDLNKVYKPELKEKKGKKQGTPREKELPAIEGAKSKLESLRKKLCEVDGAGHYFSCDRDRRLGGKRDWMRREQVEQVLQLVSYGEKKVNLKGIRFTHLIKMKIDQNEIEISSCLLRRLLYDLIGLMLDGCLSLLGLGEMALII